MSSFKLGFTALSFALCFGAAHAASAQTCTTDQDCPVGLSCVVSGHVSDAKPVGANDLATATGSGATSGTEINEIKTCEPKACVSAADCGAGMLCHKQESTACSGGTAVAPCEKGATCPTTPPSETVCTSSVTFQCAFAWQLPCNVDTDCGEGFACQPSLIGSCSGGSSSGGSSSGTGNASGSAGVGGGAGTGSTASAPDSSPAPDDNRGSEICTTTSVYPGSCQPKSVSCAQNADCPTPWTCQELVATAVARDTSGTGAGAVSGSGTNTSTRMCVSPYGGLASGSGKGSPTSGDHGATGGTTGGAPSDGNRPAEPPTAATVSAEDATRASGGGGCAIATPTGSPALAGGVASLLLLALSLRRRRR